jgi:hypothetical protein
MESLNSSEMPLEPEHDCVEENNSFKTRELIVFGAALLESSEIEPGCCWVTAP